MILFVSNHLLEYFNFFTRNLTIFEVSGKYADNGYNLYIQICKRYLFHV